MANNKEIESIIEKLLKELVEDYNRVGLKEAPMCVEYT